MNSDMIYFLITEASLVSDPHRSMNVKCPLDTLFVLCPQKQFEIDPYVSQRFNQAKILKISETSPQKIAQTICDRCKKFTKKVSILLDYEALPRETLSEIYVILAKMDEHVYFANFSTTDDEPHKEFIDISPSDQEIMLFEVTQNFNDDLPK